MQRTFQINLLKTTFTAMFIVAVLSSASYVSAVDDTALQEAIRLTNYGVEAAQKGLWNEASIRWQQAINIFPNFPAAHNNLAVVYEHFGDYDKAKTHYSQAIDLLGENRYAGTNNRMFLQFWDQYVKQLEDRKTRRQERNAGKNVTTDRKAPDTAALTSISQKSTATFSSGAKHNKVGTSRQVFIKHPSRATPLSEKYRRVYIAGFTSLSEELETLNFECTEYIRSELRKFPTYSIVNIDELDLPQDEDELDRMIDDSEFWENLGNRVGADLIVYGIVNFYDEASDGYYPYEYRSQSGRYEVANTLVRRTAFSIELDLFFHETATGELVHEESFGQTIVFRGRQSLTLQAFFDVMNRLIPRFLDLMIPREHDAIRYLLKG